MQLIDKFYQESGVNPEKSDCEAHVLNHQAVSQTSFFQEARNNAQVIRTSVSSRRACARKLQLTTLEAETLLCGLRYAWSTSDYASVLYCLE